MENNLTVNDGKGLFDKYGIIDEVLKKIDLLADARGAFRCGLVWDICGMIKALKSGLKDEDNAKNADIEELKRSIVDLRNIIEGGQNGTIQA